MQAPRKILVATDFSPSAERAVATALALAAPSQSPSPPSRRPPPAARLASTQLRLPRRSIFWSGGALGGAYFPTDAGVPFPKRMRGPASALPLVQITSA